MTFEQKKQLVILLNKYKQEILETDTHDRKADKFYCFGGNGNKAKLNHCRILENRLALEIEKEMYGLTANERKEASE